MNLESVLERRLWDAVRTSVEARKYSSAILDAIHLLTDVIRERSGLEGDGVSLVGAAFGGNAPKLKVNRLRTETEQNIQRGTEAMLRGLYQAIRNPRSHEVYNDNERDATALLLFVDYLLRVVDTSGGPFSLDALVAQVLDSGFVPSERYAALLVSKIPEKKRLATCREVFARRADADGDKVKFFFAAVLAKLAPEDAEEMYELISRELREDNDAATIRFVIQAFPSTVWPKLDELSRLRAEHKLIESVNQGKIAKGEDRCRSGGLGTWASSIAREFTLKDELWAAVCVKLESADAEEQDYAFRFFTGYVKSCFDAPPARLTRRVLKGIEAGDIRFKQLAQRWTWDFGEPNTKWISPFADALAKFVEATETPAVSEAEGYDQEIPF
jgi:uncharacterized protein (TIGR02391 family)